MTVRHDIGVSDNLRVNYAMKIVVVALEGFFDTGLTGIMDVLSTANSLSAAMMGGATKFNVSVVGMRKTVRSALGLTIPATIAPTDARPDWVIVPALKTVTPETLLPALARADVRGAVKQIADWRAQGARVAAACIGTYIIAEAGVLDGREATSTWSLAPLFRQRYPNVTLDESRMLVRPTRV